jgi:hypothetical protein
LVKEYITRQLILSNGLKWSKKSGLYSYRLYYLNAHASGSFSWWNQSPYWLDWWHVPQSFSPLPLKTVVSVLTGFSGHFCPWLILAEWLWVCCEVWQLIWQTGLKLHSPELWSSPHRTISCNSPAFCFPLK